MLAVANDLCRLELEAALQATADAQPARVQIDGTVYAHHEAGTAEYHSLCGPLQVRRATYRKTGERNGPTVVPLELAAGLIDGATPALAYRVALGYAQGPGRHAEEQMHADHRQPPSRSTLERLAKAIGAQITQAAPRIEPVGAPGGDGARRGPGRLGGRGSHHGADGRGAPLGHAAHHAPHTAHDTVRPHAPAAS